MQFSSRSFLPPHLCKLSRLPKYSNSLTSSVVIIICNYFILFKLYPISKYFVFSSFIHSPIFLVFQKLFLCALALFTVVNDPLCSYLCHLKYLFYEQIKKYRLYRVPMFQLVFHYKFSRKVPFHRYLAVCFHQSHFHQSNHLLRDLQCTYRLIQPSSYNRIVSQFVVNKQQLKVQQLLIEIVLYCL